MTDKKTAIKTAIRDMIAEEFLGPVDWRCDPEMSYTPPAQQRITAEQLAQWGNRVSKFDPIAMFVLDDLAERVNEFFGVK